MEPNLRSTALAHLRQHEKFTDAVKALADDIAQNEELRRAIAADYLKRLPQAKRGKELHSRRRVGPHRRAARPKPMPTTSQKAGALAAERTFATTIFDRKLRGGRKLGEVRIHELRAIAEESANTATSFLQRGYDDAVETFACVMLSKHCVAADPFAKVRDTIKPTTASAIFESAKIKAAQMLRDGGATLAQNLIAAAQAQELPSP
jgi:hypothetical protein